MHRIIAAALTLFWSPWKTLAVLAGVGLGTVLDTNRAGEHHTAMVLVVAVLTVLDTITWWLGRDEADDQPE